MYHLQAATKRLIQGNPYLLSNFGISAINYLHGASDIEQINNLTRKVILRILKK
jgi:hypothetical protein